MQVGQNVSLRSLYSLRDNAGNLVPAGAFSRYEVYGAMMHPRTPGTPAVERVFAGTGRRGGAAGRFHIGSLGSIPPTGLEAGALNLDAFAVAGPVSNGGVPSFGSSSNPAARPASSNMLDGQQVGGTPVVVPVHMAFMGPAAPRASVLVGRQGSPLPPIGLSPPGSGGAPSGGGAAPPASSNLTPWLVGGGAVLAFLYLGQEDKKKRRR
jgi:hypothetical protein